jgi:hypothetical protein
MGGVNKIQDYYGSVEINLNVNPWFTFDGKENTASKLFRFNLLGKFSEAGYTLYASVDHCKRVTGLLEDLESWMFKKTSII